MNDIVFLNGEYVPQQEAKISVMDRGFLFGDAVYEVIPVYQGKPLGAEEHIERLAQSLEAIYLELPYDRASWLAIIDELIQRNRNDSDQCGIYIQISRGAEDTRCHAIPESIQPTCVAFCIPSRSRSKQDASQGFRAITRDDARRRDNYIKATTLLPNILLYEEARRANALEAILIRDGEVLECTSSNLFIIKNNEIFTPPASKKILSGITRQFILEIAEEQNIPCHEQIISEPALQEADEIWVTGSSKEICPITTLNDQPVGTGTVGPMWHKMRDWYDEKKEKA